MSIRGDVGMCWSEGIKECLPSGTGRVALLKSCSSGRQSKEWGD